MEYVDYTEPGGISTVDCRIQALNMTSIFVQFPPPPRRSHMTAMEQEGQLKAVPETLPFSIPDYPQLQIKQEMVGRSNLQRESAQLAFLTQEQALWRKALQTWKSDGFISMLEEIDESKEVPAFVGSLSLQLLKFLTWVKSTRVFLFPQISTSPNELMSKYSHVSNWSKSPIQAFAWHPHIVKFAIALHDDSVQVHTAGSSICPLLKHKLQKQVADIAWQPLSASVLAVACQSCVLIWHVDPTSLAVRPSTSTVQVLRHSNHYPITSLAWSPDSSHLISASPNDSSLMVWDVPCETGIALKRDWSGGFTFLSYSPDGTKLFTGTPSKFFRIWETRKWCCETWSQLSGHCTAACWNPDGTVLLFAMEGESALYAVRFNKSGGSESPESLVATSVMVADLSPVDVLSETDDTVQVGGQVKSIVWDKTGERVAVMFEDSVNGGSKNIVALFKATSGPVLELLPGGFIKGKTGESAHHIAFQPSFSDGALLSVVWSSGHIGYLPMYFVPSKSITSRQSIKFVDPLSPFKSPLKSNVSFL